MDMPSGRVFAESDFCYFCVKTKVREADDFVVLPCFSKSNKIVTKHSFCLMGVGPARFATIEILATVREPNPIIFL